MASEPAVNYRDSIVIDGLNTSNWAAESVMDDLVEGGVTAINATIAIWEDFASALDNIMEWPGRFERFSNRIRPVLTVSDIKSAKREGRCGVIFGWQNAAPFGSDLRRVRMFHDLGVRIVQVTYNERNLYGNGCYERHDDGLSRFGVDLIGEMNRVGILVDLSHTGDRSSLEAIETSTMPVAFTHVNARSQDDHPRNKTDEAIRALVERDGVIGANAFPMFLPAGYDSTVSDYVDRIDFLVDLAGVDAVAIGTDFCQSQPKSWFEWIFSSQGSVPAEHVPYTPEPYRHLKGMEGTSQFSSIVEELDRRGYEAVDIEKIIGGNWLRLFSEVWAV